MIHLANPRSIQATSVNCIGRPHTVSGFTIVELLVVIAIISVLLGLLLPALRSIRTNMHLTNEMNTARQLMVAYHAYTNTNRDHLLTGVAPADFSVFDQDGRLLTGTVQGISVRTYPWRIAPYLSFDMRGLFVNQHRDILDMLQHEESEADYIYKVAVAPSLGINAQWVGGDASSGVQPPAFLQPSMDEAGTVDPEFQMWHDLLDMRRYYVTRSSQVLYPHRLIVFASARSRDSSGIIGGNAIIEGNYRIQSPYRTALKPDPHWSEAFHPNLEPNEYGHVSPRYFRRAVTAFMDGSVDALDTRQLRDMRHWANWADREDWVLPLND